MGNQRTISLPERRQTMTFRSTASLLLAGLALAPLATPLATSASAQTVTGPSSKDIVLSIGRGQLISINGNMADIFIADDGIADVQIKSQRQLYIFGKSGGATTVYASNSRGDIIWSANVRVGSNIDSIDQMLALAIPEAKVSVATMGAKTILLTGTVAAPEDAAEVERLVEAFTDNQMQIITRLKTATPLQVNLRVRIAEVNRNFARQIGVNYGTFDNTSGFRFGITTGRNAIPQFTTGETPVFAGGTSASAGTSFVTGNGSGSTIAAFGR